MKHIILSLFMYALFVVQFFHLLGQVSTSVRGRVYNQKNNEPIPFANVVVDGTTIGSTTDFDGKFVIIGLDPGFYRLRVSAVGYQSYVTEEIQVSTARAVYLEVPMIERVVGLQEVTIVSLPFERRQDAPTSAYTIGASEIEKNPGANRDISKILQTYPGVGSTVSFRNDLIVRGGGPNENAFYLDNIEIPNLNHFATQGSSGGPVSIINADFLRQVDFYTGGFPVNKSHTLSSIVDMKLIDGNSERMNKKFTIGASDLALTFEGPFYRDATILFSARRSYLQFLFEVIGLPFLPTYNDYLVKYKWNIDKKRKLTVLNVGAYDVSKLNLSKNETPEQQYILQYLPEYIQWNYTTGAVYQIFHNNFYENWILSRNMLRNRYYKYANNDPSQGYLSNYVSDEIENKVRYEQHWVDAVRRISYGGGITHIKYKNNTYQKFYQDSPMEMQFQSYLEFFRGFAFLQISQQFNRLTLTGGLRVDANTYSENMLNPLSHITFSSGMNYRLTERISLNASAGRYVQLPPYTVLGYRNDQNQLQNRETVEYIKVYNFVGGLSYDINQNSQLTAEAFYKYYNDYPISVQDGISLANKGSDFGVVGNEAVVSGGKGRTYGFELMFRAKKFRSYSTVVTYTFAFSEFANLDGKYLPSAWDQRHILNALFSKQWKGNWLTGLKFRFAGGVPYTPFDEELSANVFAWNVNPRGYLDYTRFNSLRFPPSHQLDLRIDKTFYRKNFSLNLYLDIQNVYNFQAKGQDFLILERDEQGNPIVVNPDAPLIEQKYQLRRIENSIGSVIPTIGLTVEF